MSQSGSEQVTSKCAPDAETLAELNVETRTILAYEAPEAAVKTLLPEGWKASPAESGPWPGANLLVIFADRLLVQNADGAPLPGQATNQLAVVAVPVQHPEKGTPGVMIVYGLSAADKGSPGPYNVFEEADAEIERSTRFGTGEAPNTSERWSFAGKNGERLRLQLRYTRDVPNRSKNVPTRAYSAANPAFHRIYCADQGVYILRSHTPEVNRVSDFEFSADGPRLGPLFDGSERLVSIVSVPWTVREAFLPSHA